MRETVGKTVTQNEPEEGGRQSVRQNTDKRVSGQGLLGGNTVENDERRDKERDVSGTVGKTVKQDEHSRR